MSGEPLLTVAEALARVLASAPVPLGTEEVPLAAARGRTLAGPLPALRTQPPLPVSAMDGYALRAADIAGAPATLRLVGTSAAGRGFSGRLDQGEAVRIFTGAPVPPGADTILMQENARAGDGSVTALQAEPPGRHIRRAGLDFREGEIGLPAGRRLAAAELALAAAMNHATLPVVRRPRVALLATGDELVAPGSVPGPDQIVCSNTFALAAIVEAAGGIALDLGIAGDSMAALAAAIGRAQASDADVLLTVGGASVGDHDLVQPALVEAGMTLGFWKVGMRPGKPLMHGRLGAMRVLGLPGNPVSAVVCGVLFVRPLVRALSGDPEAGLPATETAELGAALPPNEARQDYVRAGLVPRADGPPLVTPAGVQDSSMLSVLAAAQALIVRPPHEPALAAGAPCRIIRLVPLLG